MGSALSTIDPRLARAEKAARARRSGGSIAAATIVGVLHLALWTVAGYGLDLIYDSPRSMALNPIGEGWARRFETMPLPFILGVVLGTILRHGGGGGLAPRQHRKVIARQGWH